MYELESRNGRFVVRVRKGDKVKLKGERGWLYIFGVVDPYGTITSVLMAHTDNAENWTAAWSTEYFMQNLKQLIPFEESINYKEV